MNSPSRRVLGSVVALGAGLALLTAPPVAQAAPAQPTVAVSAVTSPVPQSEWCARPLSRLELYRGSSRFDPPGTLTLLDETQPIDLNTFEIGTSPFVDVSRVMWFRSLLWLAVAAVDFQEQGRNDLAEQMAVPAIRAARNFPDPGSATPELTDLSNSIGWDEGTTFRRAEALLCLSSYTGAERIRDLLTMHAEALVDPNRYKGPPQREVHNHGMLANLVLLDLAKRLDRPDYRQIAIDRLINDSAQVFSSNGWSYEGSTLYQSVNVVGWREVADDLRNRGYAAEAAAIDQRVNQAAEVLPHLVSPTGRIATIGNSRLDDAVRQPDPNPARPLQFVDSGAGVAMGRWSWTDTNTTYWTALNRDRRGAHGHDDNQAITWQSQGLPVLVDPGQYDYDASTDLTDWLKSNVAHNRAMPASKYKNDLKVRSLNVKRDGTLDTITMESSDNGPPQIREVLVDEARKSLEVIDSLTWGKRGRLTQYWHLAPEWTQASINGNQIIYNEPGGKVLVVTTSPGASVTPVASSLVAPYAGLIASGFKQVVAAPELRISADQSLSTTFQMFTSAAAIKALPELTVTPEPRNNKAMIRWAWPPEPDDKATKKEIAEYKALKKTLKSVRGFRVQLLDPSFGWRTVVADTKSATKLRAGARKLQNGTNYQVRVAAITKRGLGPYSEPVEVTPRTVPGAPLTPELAKYGKKYRLRWVAPESDGGSRITGYVVKAGSEEVEAKKAGVTLPELPKGPATIVVQAVNEAGSGAPLRVKVTVAKNGAVTLVE